MTDIVWGDPIEVNGVRPDWLRDGDKVNPAWHCDGEISEYGYEVKDNRKIVRVEKLAHIRLPATHAYYTATSRGFTYWPGGDSAPQDWDGGEVLLESGEIGDGNVWDHHPSRSPTRIIGYRKRVEQPAIAPELVERMARLVETMAQGTQSVLEQFHPVNTGFGIAYTEAKAINDILNPDPDLTLAKSIMGDAEAIALAIKAARENAK